MASNSNPIGSELPINQTILGEQQSSSRSIAISQNGDFVVTWTTPQDNQSTEVYARRYNAQGIPQGNEFRVNTTIADEQGSAKVAMDKDGNFVITWESYDTATFNYNIFAQRYNAAGIAQGSEFKVNTFSDFDQRQANIAMNEDGDFVITWNSFNQNNDGAFDVYAQRFDKLGQAQGNEFLVNSTTDNNQRDASVSIATNNSFVIAWTGDQQIGGNQTDVYFQQFDATGNPTGSETRVNSFITGSQQDVNITADPNGNFIVTWSSLNQNGTNSDWDVYARRYNAAGVAQGDEFRVNRLTTGTQRYSSVSVESNGDFMISWTGRDSDDNIYARRYNAAGVAQGSEFLVNTNTTSNQRNSTVALDGDGDAVIIWNSDDGSSNGVFGQLFKSSELPSTSGIADVLLPANSSDLPIDLYTAFSDVETPDNQLIYSVFSNSNLGLFASAPAPNAVGKLILDFAPNVAGSSTIVVRAIDQDGLYVDTSFDVTLTPVDNPPTLTPLTSAPIAYTENDPDIAIDPTISLDDDQATIVSATVKITNFSGGDQLYFVDQNNISGTYSNGILSLSGSSSMTYYQAALRSVTYFNSSDNPSTDNRLIEFSASDGVGNSSPASRTILVTAVNDAPLLTTTSGTLTYTEGDPALTIDSTLTLADPDNTTLKSATVRITNNIASEDVLGVTEQFGITGSFDAASGVLTLSGDATLANYATVLHSVTYLNSSGAPTTAPRTIQFQVFDGDLTSNLGIQTVRVSPVNSAPVVTPSSGTVAYTEGAIVPVDSNLLVSDSDSPSLVGATVQISGYVSGEDLLSFTPQFGITGSFDATTGTLTLSSTGTPTPANYQTVLRSVTYQNTSDNPNTAIRAIEFQVDDGFALSNLGSRPLSITPTNDAPIVTLAGTTGSYTENAPATPIAAGLTLKDPDNTNLTGATVRITNFVADQDLLSFTLPAGISGNYQANTGTLTLTGTASLADYQTALQSIAYANSSDNPNPANRSIEFQVNDGTDPSNQPVYTVSVIAVNDAPVVAASAGSAAYIEDGAASIIDPGLTLTDVDSNNITGATVRIGNNVSGEDSLSFTNANGITGSYDNTTGTLTLSGSAARTTYETALRSIAYANSSQNPSPLDRTIQFQVQEGANLSNIGNRTVTVTAVNDAPTLTVSPGASAYTEATPPIAIDSNLAVLDVDSPIASATVTISNYLVEDVLSFTDQNGITGNLAGGVLTLTGSASAAAYQTALRSITYANTSNTPNTTDRIIQIKVNDGVLDSNQGNRTVQVIAANDAPTIAISSGNATYIENASGVAIGSGITLTDDGSTLSSAKVTIANAVSGQDLLNFTAQPGITGSFNAGVLTLTGSASLSDYQTILQSVTYFNSSDNPDATSRLIQFQVNDGITNSALVSRTVDITPVDDAPSLTIAPGSINYIENNSGLAIDANLLLSDAENNSISGATVQISGNYANGQDFLNFIDQAGITGSFSGGTLTLTGTAPLANYQTALRSIAYFNNSDNPDTRDRIITIQVQEGTLSSNTVSRTVQVTAAPEAPIVTSSSGSLQYTENQGATPIDSNIALSDLDSLNLQAATIRITNYVSGQDFLSVVLPGGSAIGGGFNSSTGTLTLAGSASLTEYQTVLQSIAYTNTSLAPNLAPRLVEFTVNDGGLTSNPGTRTIQITAVNTPPVATPSSSTTAYFENAPAVAIDAGIQLSDVDSPNLNGGRVTIQNFVAGQDLLSFTPLGNISGNISGGVLTLTGSDSIANYQTVLRSIAYANSSDNPNPIDRTVEIQVNDGAANSNIATRTVKVAAVDDAPIVTTSAGSSSFTESGAPSLVDTGLTLNDVDDTNLTNAAVKITNFVPGQDLLSFTSQFGITGSFDSTGALNLTGTATIADYQTVLRSVTYANSSTNPDLTTRSIAFTVNDQTQSSSPGTRSVQIASLNSAPVLTDFGGTAVYIEKGAPVKIDAEITISDADSPKMGSATISITNFVVGQDLLTYKSVPGINGSFNRDTGILTLTGAAPLTDYQLALQAVTYSNSSNNPDLKDRTIQFKVNDGNRDSNLIDRTVSLKAANDAPIVIASSGFATYVQGGTVVLDPGLLVDDADSPTLAQATVRISNYIAGQDLLSFTPQAGISGVFNTGLLTLTGANASIDSFRAALRSVTYSNSSSSPNPIARTIQFQVNDGSLNSPIASRPLNILTTNTAPTITAYASSISYVENAPGVAIGSGLTLSDDSTSLAGASVAITNFVPGQDLLNFANQNNIQGNFNSNTGILTLTGNTSLSNYQAALQSITYSNSSDNPTTSSRTVQFVVNDGGKSSNTVTRTVQVSPTNDAPIVSTSSSAIDFNPNLGAILVDDGLLVSDPDSAKLTGATVTIAGYVANQDVLSFTNQAIIKGSFNAGVLTLTGTDTVENYQAALRSIAYRNTSPSPTSASRTIQFQVTDGVTPSSPATRLLQLAANQVVTNNHAPVLDLNGTAPDTGFSTTYVMGSSPVQIVGANLTLTDADNSPIKSAVVSIANPLNGTQERLDAVTTGTNIKADYNPAGGRLTLIGDADRAIYQQVLRSITYSNSATDPDFTSRTIVFTVNDGEFVSNLPASVVTLSSVRQVNGTPGNDSLVTTEVTDAINAGAGDDTVTSTLSNLQQNDSIDGGTGTDTFVLTDGTGLATVNVANANQVTGITPNTTIAGFERFDLSRFLGKTEITGSDADNILMGGLGQSMLAGGAGNDTLVGNSSNDTLDGGTGIDRMTGGSGDDLYVIDNSGDLAIENLQGGVDTVQASVNLTLPANLENLTLTGKATAGTGNTLNNVITGNDANNLLSGNSGDDVLIGNNGNDILIGGDGNDSLTGGSGRDRLVGGLGNDSFYLTAGRAADRDIITDFKSKDDTIFVSHRFSQNLKLGKISRGQLKFGSAATSQADRFIYNRGTGALFFDADGSGRTAKMQIATIAHKPLLKNADIVVF